MPSFNLCLESDERLAVPDLQGAQGVHDLEEDLQGAQDVYAKDTGTELEYDHVSGQISDAHDEVPRLEEVNEKEDKIMVAESQAESKEDVKKYLEASEKFAQISDEEKQDLEGSYNFWSKLYNLVKEKQITVYHRQLSSYYQNELGFDIIAIVKPIIKRKLQYYPNNHFNWTSEFKNQISEIEEIEEVKEKPDYILLKKEILSSRKIPKEDKVLFENSTYLFAEVS